MLSIITVYYAVFVVLLLGIGGLLSHNYLKNIQKTAINLEIAVTVYFISNIILLFVYDASIENRLLFGSLFAIVTLVFWTYLLSFQLKLNSSSKETMKVKLLIMGSILSGFALFTILPINQTLINASVGYSFNPSLLSFAVLSQMVPFTYLRFFPMFELW